MVSSHQPTVAPRVLVLTNNKVQPFTGGGVVLASLFHQFPRQNLFVVHTDPTVDSDAGHAEHHLGTLRPQLGDMLRIVRLLSSAAIRPSRSVRVSDLAQLVVRSCRFRITPELDERIRKFDPQVIYAWTGDSVWTRLVEECAGRYRIPYVIHFMDNHVELSGGNAIERIVHAEYRRDLERVVSKASGVFTISDAMGVAYAAKFSKPVEVFHGLIDKSGWAWPGPPARGDAFTLAFTGSVESGQLNGLRDVAAAADRLTRRGRHVTLRLYLTEFYETRARQAFREFANVEYVRHPDGDGLRAALNAADLLVLAYGFDTPCIEYYRYSFATKVVPYMLSGRAILAYGPLSIEPIAYVQRGGWGEVVSEPGVDGVEQAIESLMDSPDRRGRIARAAYEAGLEEHDLALNSWRFLAAMNRVAAGGVAA